MIATIARIWPKLVSGMAILAVAAVAGVISYVHIYDLTLALHQPVMVARLMPFGVDGLITIGSLILLQAGDADRWLGWLGIGPGVAISLFANAESGARYGALAAIWSAIPAVSFALATFLLERWLKAQAHVPEVVPVPEVTVTETETVPDVTETETVVPEVVPETEPPIVPEVPRQRAPRRSAQAPADVFAAHIERGELPGIREIKSLARCGTPRAQKIHAQLSQLIAA